MQRVDGHWHWDFQSSGFSRHEVRTPAVDAPEFAVPGIHRQSMSLRSGLFPAGANQGNSRQCGVGNQRDLTAGLRPKPA